VLLRVQVLRAAGPQRGVMMLLAGGPGQSATEAFDLASYGVVWRMLFPGYTLVAFDARGTGGSGALRCPAVRANASSGTTWVAACAQQLGPRRDFYRTQDNVDDIDAVRQALGFRHVGLWGVSYGTKL